MYCNMMKKAMLMLLSVFITSTMVAKPVEEVKAADRIVVAYVCSWTNERLPDPQLMTHINYAFGHVNGSFDGVRIQNEPFLQRVVALKEQNPKLKIMLSIGGWTSGNFSEMAADADKRMSFAVDCQRIVAQYGLDGIDIDWEYPTSSEAGISSSPNDTKNFTLLMRDLRKVLGEEKLLTAATIADGKYIDFPKCIKYMDFVNIMAYDVANPPKHHTTLHRSSLSGRITVEEAIDAHIRAGVPAEKLVLGMPLYGRGDHSNKMLDQYVKTRYVDSQYQELWDEVGKVPYLADRSGQLVWAFDDTRSLAAKCQTIIDRKLLGGMYWECTEDNAQLDGMRTIHRSLMVENKGVEAKRRVLMMLGEDDEYVKLMEEFLIKEIEELGGEVTVFSKPDDVEGCEPFENFHLVVADDYFMRHLSDKKRDEFEDYLEENYGNFLAPTICFDYSKQGEWHWYEGLLQDLELHPAKLDKTEKPQKKEHFFGTSSRLKGRIYHATNLTSSSNERALNALKEALRQCLHL